MNESITVMSGKTDQIKGRIKEAAVVLTDTDRLKRKGKLDQVVGKVKKTAEKAVDKMKDALTSNRPRGGSGRSSRTAGSGIDGKARLPNG